MLPRRRLVGLAALSAAALVAAWIVTPHSIPIYDGVGFPDEPYRYVQAPAGVGVHTSPPTPAAGSTVLSGGTNPAELLAPSQEQGPQVVVFIGVHAVRAPAAATSLTVQASPRAPEGPPPGVIVSGNAYRITIGSNAGPVTLDSHQIAAVQLRATSAAQPGPSMYFRPAAGHAWQEQKTERTGNDIYQSLISGPGDYLLAFQRNGSASAGASGTPPARTGPGVPALVIVLAILVLGMAAVVIAIRVRRSRRGSP
jgi:hypothetical protein